MKKTIACLLAALLVLTCFSACMGEKPQESSVPGVTEPTPAESVPDESYEESFLPKEPGMKQLTLYWDGAAKLETSDVWMWHDDAEGRGYLFTRCAYGFKCQVNVPESVEEVGFIVRYGCSDPGGTSWGEASKDYPDDRFAILTGEETVIYLKQGDGKQYTSEDGGKTLAEIRAFKMAALVSETEIRYNVAPAARITSLDEIKVYQDGEALPIESLTSLNNEVVVGTIKMKEPLDITKSYELEINGYGRKAVLPTNIFDSDTFQEAYLYDGDDLGAVVNGDHTTFKVWAPTASAVDLNLFTEGNGGEPYETHLMERGEKGVWTFTAECGHGTYYTYTVQTAAGRQDAVDPYARAAGVNGDRAMVIDLKTTDPEGFENDTYRTGLSSYDDAVVWEVHVRDFSNRLPGSRNPGKYIAFTETDLKTAGGNPAGLDYVKDLGITHIHLQPVYDFATVDETTSDEFNWGYDPKNYNVPEGSYSTDPFHGEVRVKEFKEMVQAIHNAGMGVVMDVVYNHTYDGNSSLNKIVPYYYYRYTSAGVNSNGSGCGNETASERQMFRKYMVDSVTYWAKEYHIDGFRFDLMALHDLDTMQEIEQALHKINPECLIYGEGWTGGTTTLPAKRQATQSNIKKITASEGAIGSVAVFNDAIRDGLKGSVFDEADAGYINGVPTKAMAHKIIFGLTGGKPNVAVSWEGSVINYASCHDNLTLYDKLKATNPDADDEAIASMTKLSAAAVLLGRGTPFMLAGEEMLRTKGGDHNSYKSSDEVNNIDWNALDQEIVKSTSDYYKTLIKIRQGSAYLKDADVSAVILDDLSIEVIYEKDGKAVGYAILNPNDRESSVTLPEGNYSVEFGSAADFMPLEGLKLTALPKSAALVSVTE